MTRVRVLEVIDETTEARSFVLDLPWTYLPGQFVTVRVGDAARSYSLSSSPHTGEQPKITVKRVADGYGSNWICENIAAGAELELLAPGGVFTPADLDRDVLLVAGGSGITPIMSILKSILHAGSGRVSLVYANRDPDSVIFAAELDGLVAQHGARLEVDHWLDSERGFPTIQSLGAIEVGDREIFVCGPEPLMALAQQAWGNGIHVERFVSMTDNPFVEQAPADRFATVEVAIDGQNYHFDWPVGMKLLDLLISKGINAPFSCRQGTCGACACRILSGEVKLLNNEVLEEEDFADNYILACQAVPLTDDISITYY